MQELKPCPILVGERTVLRPVAVSDAEDLFHHWSAIEIREPGAVEKPDDLMSVECGIEYFNSLNAAGYYYKWAIRDRVSNHFLGEIELFPLKVQIKPWHEWSIGFSLAKKEWGKGLMTESVQEVLDFAFTQMHVRRIKADVVQNNERSKKLLAKFGFRYEGLQVDMVCLDGNYLDLLLLAVSANQYKEHTILQMYLS